MEAAQFCGGDFGDFRFGQTRRRHCDVRTLESLFYISTLHYMKQDTTCKSDRLQAVEGVFFTFGAAVKVLFCSSESCSRVLVGGVIRCEGCWMLAGSVICSLLQASGCCRPRTPHK